MTFFLQRQTLVSQFFQLDRLVVEGQKTVSSPLIAGFIPSVWLANVVTSLS